MMDSSRKSPPWDEGYELDILGLIMMALKQEAEKRSVLNYVAFR